MAATDTMSSNVIFKDLNAEDEQEISEIESLCLHCYQQGVTRLMLTKIPFFREVVISSFQCDACSYSDCSIQSAGCLQEKGVKYTLTVSTAQDLNRQIVRSEYATLSIPELEFEQEANGKGEINTVEGLLDNIVTGLQLMQSKRKEVQPEHAAKIDEFIERVKKLKSLTEPFTLIVDDASGNSYVENPNAPSVDASLTVVHYTRTDSQNEQIGCQAAENPGEAGTEASPSDSADPDEAGDSLKDEVLKFNTNCPHCHAPCHTNMKLVDIPFFKQVVIMATVCDVCSHRDNEVKGGTGIEPTGTRINLHLTNISDLNRDVLKSDTCAVKIPELEFETAGTMGGQFTTVEGLLTQIKDQLQGHNPFVTGDSAQDGTRGKLKQFCERLNQIIQGEMLDIHIILDDPAGNSYLQNIYAPDPDPEMVVEHYERSYDDNEFLGLNDMRTEDYSTDT